MNCIKLASNENPFGPSPRAVAAMQAAAAECNWYPDDDAGELRRKLAERHSVAPEQTLVGAGSSDLIGILCRALLGPGLKAATSRRSFIVYSIACKAAGGTLIEIPTKNDGYDLGAMADAVDGNTRIVFLANPNNPTGTVFDAPALDRFLEKIPGRVTVIVDEAYYDFAQYFAASRGIEYSHSPDYVRQGRNVVVLRTFSKAHGLAGLRVGYALGPAGLLRSLRRQRTTFSVSVPAQAAALAALEDEGHIQRTVENNAQGAEFLVKAISGLGFRALTTWANFVYCELGEDAVFFAKRMQAEGVIIRPLGFWGAPKAIRVTIGTPEQNRYFMDTFKRIQSGTAGA